MYVGGPDGVVGVEGFYLVAEVFFFVGDDEVGLKAFDDVCVDVFGTADAGFRFVPVFGMYAEFCDAYDLLFESKVVKKFCLGRDERDDAPRGAVDGDDMADGICEGWHIKIMPQDSGIREDHLLR